MVQASLRRGRGGGGRFRRMNHVQLKITLLLLELFCVFVEVIALVTSG